MHTERYMFIRGELIRLYTLFTKRTFLVSMPLASVLTTAQLKHYQDHPPINGFESITQTSQRPFTISHILKAVKNSGDNFNIGFLNARQDIPVIYESIQDWIKHWVEIKYHGGYIRTPDVKELELIEKLGRYVFSAFAHYHHENINRTLHIPDINKATLIDVLRGRMMFGSDIDESISYISYLDQYKSEIGYKDYSGDASDDTLSFLRGFGGGL